MSTWQTNTRGSGTAQHTHATQLQRPHGQDGMLFAQETSHESWNGQHSKLKKRHLGSAARWRESQMSVNSNCSSVSSDQSMGSANFGFRSAVEAVPAVQGLPLAWESEFWRSDSSLRTYYTSQELQSGGHLGSSEMDVSPTEPQRAPSPRIRMREFQPGHQNAPITINTGPVDRFLAQEDEMPDYNDSYQLEEDWKRLRLLRADVLRLRSQLRAKRRELHEKETAKSLADDLFMKFVRENRPAKTPKVALHHPTSSSLSELDADTYYSKLQATRDEYGPLQYEYSILEDKLDAEEFELATIEGRLYNTKIHDFQDSAPDLLSSDALPPPPQPPESLLGLSSDATRDYHPLHTNYLSRLGDLDLVREQYQNLLEDRQQLLDLQESRTHLGIELQEDDKVFLADFHIQEKELAGQMKEIEEDVERRKAQCLAEGILIDTSHSSNSFQNDDDQDEQIFPGAEEEIVLHGYSDIPIDTLASMCSILLPESPEGRKDLGWLITDFDEANKSDRINRWILFQLQTSPIEVELLVRISLHILQLLGLYQWQRNVLSWWSLDSANKPPEAFNNPETYTPTNEDLELQPDHPAKEIKTIIRRDFTNVPHRRTRSCPCFQDQRLKRRGLVSSKS